MRWPPWKRRRKAVLTVEELTRSFNAATAAAAAAAAAELEALAREVIWIEGDPPSWVWPECPPPTPRRPYNWRLDDTTV